MPEMLLEVARGDMLYQLDAAALVWPAAGATLGLVAAVLALGLRWSAWETRPAVISVMIGYAALGAQAFVAAAAWMPVEASFKDSRHVGSLFSQALWTDLGLISLGFGLSAFALAFWLLHRPEEDPQRVPVGVGLGIAALATLGLGMPGHAWGVEVAAVGVHPQLRLDELPRFHAGQRIERQPKLGWHTTQGLIFKRTVWLEVSGEQRAPWEVPPLTLGADSPGAHAAVMWAARGPFTMRQEVPFEVGEDRGDPRFSPAVGQRWVYAQLHGEEGMIEAIYAGEEALPEGAATLTLEVTGEQVIEGLRLLTLARTDAEGEVDALLLYNMDGETYLRVQGGEDRPALVGEAPTEELAPPPPPPPPAPPGGEDAWATPKAPAGLWACDPAFLPQSGCWCFEEGAPRQGVAYCVVDTTDPTPGILRGVLAVLTVGITEITGAMKGVGETRTETGVVLLPLDADIAEEDAR